jgi:hypothetical protein
MSCINPWAPAMLTADGFPADSAMSTARTSPAGTPWLSDALLTSESSVPAESEWEAYGR